MIPAGEEHRRVVRKEAAIVLEDPQPQPLELPVRREDVHEVDLAADDRPVRQRVLHHAHASQRQAVVAPQSGPAVLALEESRAERRGEPGVAREVADAPERQPLGRLGTDRERVRVAEAERLAHRQSRRREARADRLGRSERRVLQDDVGERSRVLGIEVDGARRDRAIGDAGAAEAELPLDPRLAGLLDAPGPRSPRGCSSR